MKLRRLHLQNLKLLRDFRLDFSTPDGGIRPLTVLVGANGSCKTTLLQAIALAACGPEKSNQVAADLPTRIGDKRRPDEAPTVTAVFEASNGEFMDGVEGGKVQLESRVRVDSKATFFTGDSGWLDATEAHANASPNPLSAIRARGGGDWFCAGYGVGRSIPVPLSTDARSDFVLDRIKSLFDPRHQLVGTDFVSWFGPGAGHAFVRLLKEALVDFEVLPDIEDLELRGRGGIVSPTQLVDAHRFSMKLGASSLKLPATALSQGYQSMVALVADLIGQAMVAAGDQSVNLRLDQIGGLVLVDEIDLHLHPTWQAHAIRPLLRAFPNVQFIVTTHSPVVLSDVDPSSIVVLGRDEHGSVIPVMPGIEPSTLTPAGLLRSYFDVVDLDPRGVSKRLREYGNLATRADRTDDEEAEVQRLAVELERLGIHPEWEPVARAPETEREATA